MMRDAEKTIGSLNFCDKWLSKGEYRWTTTWGTHKVKPIFWISIWNGFFKILFNFSEKAKEKLLSLPSSESTKELVNETKPNGTKMKYLTTKGERKFLWE